MLSLLLGTASCKLIAGGGVMHVTWPDVGFPFALR